MDQAKVAYFHGNYSKLSDEELAHLIATRRDTLVEEAVSALTQVLKTRNLPSIETEIQATVADLRSQAAVEERRIRIIQARQRTIRKGTHILGASMSVIGAGLMMFGDSERGAPLLVCGFGLSILYEIRRLVGRGIAALFRMQ